MQSQIKKDASLSKITPPKISNIVRRKRLFKILNKERNSPILWVSAPAGSGKTTLITDYLAVSKIRCLWYQIDEGDADISTFFYYMGLAAKKANPYKRKPLPLLTPEYLQGIPAFTRRYFEGLYSRLIPRTTLPSIPSHQGRGRYPSLLVGEGRFIIVFDNYHEVPADSPFHNIIRDGMDTLPQGIRVVFVSRHEPPEAFARLRANNKMSFLGWNDIRFTINETGELIKAQKPAPNLFRGSKLKAKGADIAQLHKNTDGWAAGLVLLTGVMGGGVSGMAHKEIPGSRSLTLDTSSIFDYFASELFEKADIEMQNFLLKTSFLPSMTADMAERLTGADSAGSILSWLNRNNYFTDRLAGDTPVYQYHPLLREFLLNRAKSKFAPDESVVIQKEAALLLEQSGRIENAARLYCNTGDHDSLARMTIHHARKFLMEGRNKTVEEWMNCLPAGVIDGNPWLLYWRGMCSFPFDMLRTGKYLEKAFGKFKTINDAAGIYLSWAGIVDAYAFELDEWEQLDNCIAILNDIRRSYPVFPSKEIELFVSSRMLIALTLRKTDQPELVNGWLKIVSGMLEENPSADIQMDTLFFMSVYYIWRGDYSKNTIIFERAMSEIRHRNPSSLAVIRMKMIEAVHYWVTGQYDDALNTADEGLALSDKSGIHLFDFLLWCWRVAAAMLTGDMETAEKSLKKMTSILNSAKTLDIFYYHINFSWYAILKGNIPLAAEHLKTITAQISKMGTPYYRALWNIGMAHVAFLQGHRRDAKSHLRTAHRISLNMKSYVLEWFSLLTDAYFLYKEGKEKEGLLPLRKGLMLGKRHGYAHIEFYQPSVMQFLYAKALEEGIEPDYVKGLIRRQKLNPPIPSFEKGGAEGIWVDDWPYPIKICTLGRFEIIKDDMPLTPPRKAQKKPLEMLKSLIAIGSNGMTIEQMTDLLWQEADGDMAHKSFEITLLRLRRMLGNEKAVRLQGGLLILDRSICYVDVWAFQNLIERIEEYEHKKKTDDALRLSEKALHLYKGHFLPAETQYEWTMSLREHLRNRFHRLVIKAGSYMEKQNNRENAIEYFQKGLEIDPLCEDFYQRLILCHQKLGHKAEAVRTYNLCRTTLSTSLGITPSAKTEEIYSSL